MTKFLVTLAVALLIALGGALALAQEVQSLPNKPVWLNAGLMCETEEQNKQALDEMDTPIPFPEGCQKVALGYEILVTIKPLYTYEAVGFIYEIVEYTAAGYRYMSPFGWEFTHFYKEGEMIFLTRYGYWDKTPVEGYVPPKPEPAGRKI